MKIDKSHREHIRLNRMWGDILDTFQPEPPAPYRVACGWRRSFWTRRKDLQLSTSNHERFSICRREGKNCRCSGKGYILAVDEN